MSLVACGVWMIRMDVTYAVDVVLQAPGYVYNVSVYRHTYVLLVLYA